MRWLLALLVTIGCGGGKSAVSEPAGSAGSDGKDGGGAVDAGPVQRTGELCPTPTVRGPCPEQPPCWNTCGPAKSGFKNCACDGPTYQLACGACNYDPGQDTSCFMLPDPVPTCPPDPTDTSGMGLVASGGECTLEPCHPCGSSTDVAFRDSTGAPKVGFCVCVLNPDTGLTVYSCARLSDWPR